MYDRFNAFADAVIARAMAVVQRLALLVFVSALALAGVAVYYTAGHLKINTDMEDMLSPTLPWRASYIRYKNAFPFFSKSIVAVVDGATPDLAIDSANALVAALEQEPDLFSNVYFPPAQPFFRHNQLLYLSPARLESLAEDLAASQALLGRLAAEPRATELFDLLAAAADEAAAGDSIPIDSALPRIREAIDGYLAGDPIPLSWQRLIGGDDATTRQLVLFQPALDFSGLLPGATAIDRVRAIVEELGLTPENGVRVRLTGSAALGHDELSSVINGSKRAGIFSLITVVIVLILGLRSLSLLAASLITLIVGLIYTAAFAALSVGTLNMISIAFAVLYVGLGVDFAIHICLRYQELLRDRDPTTAVIDASRNVGTSIALCAVTTAIGFFAFIPTSYRGVAELGLIAGVGMLIGLVCSLTILPALLHLLPAPRTSASRGSPPPGFLARLPQRHAGAVLVATAVVAAACLAALPALQFIKDPVLLNDQSAESVTTYLELAADVDNSLQSAAVIAPDRASALAMKRELEALAPVDEVVLLDDLVPKDQDVKLETVFELGLTLGIELEVADDVAPADYAETIESLTELEQSLAQLVDPASAASADDRSAARPLLAAISELLGRLKGLEQNQRDEALARLDAKFLDSFRPRIELLSDGLAAAPIDLDSIPTDVARTWRTADGRYRLVVRPSGALTDNADLERFVNAVKSVAGDEATSGPVINLGAGDAVQAAFVQAFVSALVLITLLLWLLLRSWRETGLVLMPLLLAGLLTCGLCVLVGVDFNFANIIALPLLLGIGVDSALHIVHRTKTALPDSGFVLHSSTARAVLFSALTTTASFGNLALATHAGTASMGVMLSLGILSILLCTLLVLPALLTRLHDLTRA